MVVADVRRGCRLFQRPNGEAYRPRGKVLAVDVQPEMLAILKNRAAKAKVTNIQPISDRSRIRTSPAVFSDLILMVDVIMSCRNLREMLQEMKQAIKS